MGRLRPVRSQGIHGRRSDQARLAGPGQHGDRLVQAVQQPVAGQRAHAGRRQRLVGRRRRRLDHRVDRLRRRHGATSTR